MKRNSYTDEQLEAAKTLYLGYNTLSSISADTKISRASLLYYIPKWREERESLKSEIIDALSDSKKNLMYSIAKNGLEILGKSMEALSKSNRVLTAKEMIGITNIIESLDKITKLDEGNPTEILAEIRPATIVEVRKLLTNDPFLEVEDAQVIDPPVTNS